MADTVVRFRPSLANANDKSSSMKGFKYDRMKTDMVSYEDLLVAQYLEELRKNRIKVEAQAKREKPPSPYLQHQSQFAYPVMTKRTRQHRPMSATTPMLFSAMSANSNKPKIDAKFIADPNLWEAATPRGGHDTGTRMDSSRRGSAKRQRPLSAPVKMNRPWSATASMCSLSRNGLLNRPTSGRKHGLYKKQPHTIVVLAYRNGSRDVFARLAAPNMKMLLELCTVKLSLPFAARRIFLEHGVEVFARADIRKEAEIYVSMGEVYKDPYENAKLQTLSKNGAVWTMTGVVVPDEGKKKPTKTRISKRLKKSLLDRKRVRIMIFHNSKSSEPAEVVADLDNMEEFLVACTAKLDLRSHARTLFDCEGTEIDNLAETPLLEDCYQMGSTPALGPLWVATGEGFNPIGARDYLVNTIEIFKAKIKETKDYHKQLCLAKDEENDKVTLTAVLSMSEDEIYEALEMADSDLEKCSAVIEGLKDKLEGLQQSLSEQEIEGPEYLMKHIQKLDADNRLVGRKGLRLKVYENGMDENEEILYFNLRDALKGIGRDKKKLMQRIMLNQKPSVSQLTFPVLAMLYPSLAKLHPHLAVVGSDQSLNSLTINFLNSIQLLDELSFSRRLSNPQNPKLTAVARMLYDKFGNEITDVLSLKCEQEVWLSFGEPFISPFTYCLEAKFDMAKGYELTAEDLMYQEQIIIREPLKHDDVSNKEDHSFWLAQSGFPPEYKYSCEDKTYNILGYEHIRALQEFAEVDSRAHFLTLKKKPEMILYPELVMNQKVKRGHKDVWPAEAQIWVISKSGHIICKAFPQLCLAVGDTRVDVTVSKQSTIEGLVVGIQKKTLDSPYQKWTFNTDATIICQAYSDLALTYLGNLYGDSESEIIKNTQGTKSGDQVYLILANKLPAKHNTSQRFGLKQERFDNLGQWKHTEAPNPEWNKLAYSWPIRQNGRLNEKYDWPMEAYIIPNAPPLTKKENKTALSGVTPLRLSVLKNGERDRNEAVLIVGPNLTNMMKETASKAGVDKQKHHQGRSKSRDNMTVPAESVDEDILVHPVREIELTMFLDHCTSLLCMPFAARRLFDENGMEHHTLADLQRDQLVYVTCGEPWADPSTTKAEQQKRVTLSQLSHDVAKIRQYCAIRHPYNLVLEVEGALVPNTPLIVNTRWVDSQLTSRTKDAEDEDAKEMNSIMQDTLAEEEEEDTQQSAHHRAHERSEERHNRLKWPWERLINVSASQDLDDEAKGYTDKELYEKYKPKMTPRVPHDTLQRFIYQDGYIASADNHDLVLGVKENEGRIITVVLAKRKTDDIYQRWTIKENGEIRSKYHQQFVLTVAMPMTQAKDSAEKRLLSYVGCQVTLQQRKIVNCGRANQIWLYDAETGVIMAFATDQLDKEITAANKTDVCTFTVTRNMSLNQAGYIAEIPVTTAGSDRVTVQNIHLCLSCSRSVRGRYKLEKLTSPLSFPCAMGLGIANKLKLHQLSSFRVLTGKVDLSTHEADHTLEQFEDLLRSLREKTSVKAITKEISAAKTVRPVKILAYKNGEGRLRQGELIAGSSVQGLLSQTTHRLGLTNAATKFYTEDGTLILDMDELYSWATENYKAQMWTQMDKMFELGGPAEVAEEEDDDEEHVDSLDDVTANDQRTATPINLRRAMQGLDLDPEQDEDGGSDPMNGAIAEDQNNVLEETNHAALDEADNRRREYILNQVELPPLDVILRYPIEVWVSTGRSFVPLEVVESKSVNRRKKRAFRSAVALELDVEKHILRQMKGRRFDECEPGEYIGTRNSAKPVVKEGHWLEVTPEEQVKQEQVKKLQTHLTEIKSNQAKDSDSVNTLNVSLTRRLYKQPTMKRVLVYPNGETMDRAIYIWGENLSQLLDQATSKLGMWRHVKLFYTTEGQVIDAFDDIGRDQIVCAATGKGFARPQKNREDVEVKANWSRARKQYGPTATDYKVSVDMNPTVNVDPFGPPQLALDSQRDTSRTTQ